MEWRGHPKRRVACTVQTNSLTLHCLGLLARSVVPHNEMQALLSLRLNLVAFPDPGRIKRTSTHVVTYSVCIIITLLATEQDSTFLVNTEIYRFNHVFSVVCRILRVTAVFRDKNYSRSAV